jgi:hypothetical protein
MLDAPVKSSLLKSCRTLSDELSPQDQPTRGFSPLRFWPAIAVAAAVGLGIFLVKLTGRF